MMWMGWILAAASGCTLLSGFPYEDEAQVRLIAARSLALRWDNLGKGAQWVAGQEPERDKETGFDVVRLAPGEWTEAHFATGSVLRLIQPGERLVPSDIEAECSDGNGLYVGVQPITVERQGELLLQGPEGSSALFRLRRPASSESPISLALFVPRYETLPDIIGYRTEVLLPAPKAELRAMSKQTGDTYWYLEAGQPVTIELAGPARLLLRHRAVFAPDEPEFEKQYAIEVTMDDLPYGNENGNENETSPLIPLQRGIKGEVSSDSPSGRLEFQTRPDLEDPVEVDGIVALLGHPFQSNLNVPEGSHQLTLRPEISVYLWMIEADQPAFLFEQVNEPWPGAWDIRDAARTEDSLRLDVHPGEQEIRALLEDKDTAPFSSERVYRAACELAWNASHQDGGLLAAALLRREAAKHPEYTGLSRWANDRAAQFVFHRTLRPDTVAPGMYFARYLRHKLLEPGADPLALVAAESQLPAMLREVPTGLFVPLAPGDGLRYALPERAAGGHLRIAVDTEGWDPLFVQYDNAAAIQLRAGVGDMPWARIRPTQDGVAHALLQQQAGRTDVAGLLAGGDRAQRFVPAAFAELPLPSEVRTIHVWRETGDALLAVSLAYEASRELPLTEQEYKDLLTQLPSSDSPYALLVAALRGESTETSSEAEKRLTDLWAPLMRLVEARRLQFEAQIPEMPSETAALAARAPEQAAETAEQSAAQGRWVDALEQWNEVLASPDPELQFQARMGRAGALEHTGEHFLSDTILRGLLVRSPSAEQRREAFLRLRQRLMAGPQDLEALITLYCAMAAQDPDAALLGELAGLLMDSREFELALLLALALPEDTPPAGTIVRAACQLDWKETFETHLSSLESMQQLVWKGRWAQQHGDLVGAEALFSQAGDEGLPWLAALQSTQALIDDLDGPLDARDWVRRWEQLQATGPGFRTWRGEEELVSTAKAARLLYSAARNRYGTGFEGSAEQPVVCEIAGPCRVQFEIRPIHPTQDPTDRLEGWVKIREGGRLWTIPVCANVVTSGLTLQGDPVRGVGIKETFTRDFSAGIHRVELSSDTFDILVAPMAERPETPLALLPPVSKDGISQLFGSGHTPEAALETPWELWVFPPVSAAAAPIPMASRLSSTPVGSVDWPPADDANPQDIGYAENVAHDLGQEAVKSALERPYGTSTEELLARMTLLAWAAEQDPAMALARAVDAEELFIAHGDCPPLQPLYERLMREFGWRPVNTVESDAGVQLIERTGSTPAEPEGRIRRALFRSGDAPEEVQVMDFGSYYVDFDNLASTNVEMSFHLDSIEFVATQPLRLEYQLDDQPAQPVDLSSEHPMETIQVPIPEGPHTLRTAVVRRAIGNAVRMRLTEDRGDGQKTPLIRSVKELWHVATAEEPFRVAIEGPTMLRVLERIGDEIKCSRKKVETGLQVVEFRPEPGHEEALFRLSALTHQPNKPEAEYNRAVVQYPVAPTPLGRLEMPPPPTQARLEDVFPLGKQELGTWTLASGYQRRLNTLEPADSSAAESFYETSATYRYFDESHQRYYRGTLLTRLRADGSPSFGWRGRVHASPEEEQFSWILGAEAYAQSPRTLVGEKDLEWQGLAEGTVLRTWNWTPKLRHTASASLFLRAMSQQDNLWVDEQERTYDFLDKFLPVALHAANPNAEAVRRLTEILNRKYTTTHYDPEGLDTDVFSPYKADHQVGVRFSDVLRYSPSLDTECYAGVSLGSNENLISPDYLRMRLGGIQQLGALQLSAEYSYARYFKDSDRSAPLDRSLFEVALAHEHFFKNQDRLEVSLSVSHDVERAATLGAFGISWHFGHGRAYRDFDPAELDMDRIRAWRVPQTKNNRIEYENEP